MLPISGEAQAVQALSNLIPFVAMIDVAELCGGPMFQWHFVVPLFLTADQLAFHDPADGPDRRVPRDDFLAA